MVESHHQASTSSRLGIKTTDGEIVEVQGGHIVRSIGRKDRHSKVCTAKGPRDRRVRLSAHTAIQFYDVQDRLGYDRPSKAVDWLIKKAKASIDELAKLPAWVPTTMSNSASYKRANEENKNPIGVPSSASRRMNPVMVSTVGEGSRVADSTRGLNLQRQMVEHHSSNSSAFLPSFDSDAIADTNQPFFPVGASNETSSLTTQFNQSYPPGIISRTRGHSQDLRLSLQPIQDPIFLQHHQAAAQTHENELAFFSGTLTQLGYDGSGWTEHHPHQADSNRFQRMVAWNGGDTGNVGGDDGEGSSRFMFNPLPTTSQSLQQPPLQPSFSRSQFFPQRGPLQSSNSSSVRALIDPTFTDHQISSSISGMGFAYGGFPGFHIPVRIQGEEEHDGISDKPSTASSDSRH